MIPDEFYFTSAKNPRKLDCTVRNSWGAVSEVPKRGGPNGVKATASALLLDSPCPSENGNFNLIPDLFHPYQFSPRSTHYPTLASYSLPVCPGVVPYKTTTDTDTAAFVIAKIFPLFFFYPFHRLISFDVCWNFFVLLHRKTDLVMIPTFYLVTCTLWDKVRAGNRVNVLLFFVAEEW